jgi:nucleoid-associated protein YgaU
MNRNEKRVLLLNKNKLYKKRMDEKNLNFIRQVSTLKFNSVTPADISNLTVIDHVWKTGDKLYKLAKQYYGDNSYWFLLAWFNNKPTDAHLAYGDLIHIPTPLEKVLYLYNR